MITIWESEKEVNVVPLSKWKPGHLSWIDCEQPTHNELAELSKATGVTLAHLRECVNPNKRPRVMPLGASTLFVLRGINKDASHAHTVVFSIFVFKNFVVTLHEKPVRGIERLREVSRAEKAELLQSAALFAYHTMDAVIGGFFRTMEQIEQEMDTVETQVMKEPSRLATQKLFVLKRRLIYIQKALFANRDVIASAEKSSVIKTELNHFHDLYNDVAQLLDLVSVHRDILTTVMEMYIGSVNNNLNKVVKTLTILSAYVMVPVLIASIYGMNFRFMPEITWKYGYVFSLVLMAVSVLVFHSYFKRKGWLGWP